MVISDEKVISDKNRPLLIIDAKYKNEWENVASNKSDKPEREDCFQIMSYMYRAECKFGGIFCPQTKVRDDGKMKEYSIFVDTVRIQCKKTSDTKHAVTKAVDICIEKGILRDVLVKHKAEVISMVLTSFNQKAYEEDLKNQYKEGIEEGFSLGRMQMAQEIALRLFQSGNSPEQIAQLTGIDVEAVKQWIEKAK